MNKIVIKSKGKIIQGNIISSISTIGVYYIVTCVFPVNEDNHIIVDALNLCNGSLATFNLNNISLVHGEITINCNV